MKITKLSPEKPKRGGARKGAGLPKIDGGKRVALILAPKHISKAKKLGDGNVSKGIRFALDRINDK
jgi:hypothetical protein